MRQQLRKVKEHPLISKRLYSKKRLIRTSKIAFLASIPVLVFCAVSWLSFLDAFQIRDISVKGTEVLSAQAIQAKAESLLVKPFLYFFSRNTALTYPKAEIYNAVTGLGLRVEEVKVSLVSARDLGISVTERTQEALWCADGQCLLIDDEGLAFDYGSSSAALVFESSDADVLPELGSYVATSSDFKAFMKFDKSLDKLGLMPTHVLLGKEGDITLTVATSSLKLVVAFGQNFDKTYQYLMLLKNDPTFKNHITARDLEYIDLRFGNKVYYKPKGSLMVASSTLEKKVTQ